MKVIGRQDIVYSTEKAADEQVSGSSSSSSTQNSLVSTIASLCSAVGRPVHSTLAVQRSLTCSRRDAALHLRVEAQRKLSWHLCSWSLQWQPSWVVASLASATMGRLVLNILAVLLSLSYIP